MPKGPKITRTKQHKASHKTNRPLEQTTKQQTARPTPGPPDRPAEQTTAGVVGLVGGGGGQSTYTGS